MTKKVLIVTIGGSYQPVVTAVQEIQPDYVCFLCTDKDGATGRPGSRIQVEGKGKVIRSNSSIDQPDLPNIPNQLQLKPDNYSVVLVASDDLDNVINQARRVISELKAQFPNARMIADYTGGTKTMTAGLVLAALEDPDVDLRLVTGARSDLTKVRDGTQQSTPASVDSIRFHLAIAPHVSAWSRYAYGETAKGLSEIPSPRVGKDRDYLQLVRDLSRALDAWDRFDHETANELLGHYRGKVGQHMAVHFNFLQKLLKERSQPKTGPANLMDLWRNAERRAAQGRYDDAVARCYRLLEWTAQWLLHKYKGFDTADLPADGIPPHIQTTCNAQGKRQAGLRSAWQLVAEFLDGVAKEFALTQSEVLLNHVNIRNHSILAHGFSPISESQWQAFYLWLDQYLKPLLLAEAKQAGIKDFAPQLPDRVRNCLGTGNQ